MTVLLVYSTGRCGTQFLQTFFQRNLGERAVVEHEPIGPEYAPKLALRHPDLPTLRQAMPIVDRHLDRIAQIVSTGKIYVETGWPTFPWVPLFKQLFGADFRYVHLIRNPIYFAYSLSTQDFYRPEKRNDAYIKLAQLEPDDPGVHYHELAADWPTLTPYEKCLFQWLEINQYAVELTARSELPSTVAASFEDLFGGSLEGLRRVYHAADAGDPASLQIQRVDRHQRRARQAVDISSSRLFDVVKELAQHFGYNKSDLDVMALRRTTTVINYKVRQNAERIKKVLRRAANRFVRG